MTPTRDTGGRRPGALRRIREASQVIRPIGGEGKPVLTGNRPTEPRQGSGAPNRPERAGNAPGRVQDTPAAERGASLAAVRGATGRFGVAGRPDGSGHRANATGAPWSTLASTFRTTRRGTRY